MPPKASSATRGACGGARPGRDEVRQLAARARAVSQGNQREGRARGHHPPGRRRQEDRLTMHYLMFYDVADDYAEKRMPFRAAHIAYARKAVARGDLVLGGALASPAD